MWAVSLKQRFVAHGHTQKQRCICLLCLPTNLQRNKLLPRRSSRPPCAGLLLGLFVVLIEPGPCSCALSYSPRPRDRSSCERMRSPVLGGRQSGCFWAPRHCQCLAVGSHMYTETNYPESILWGFLSSHLQIGP